MEIQSLWPVTLADKGSAKVRLPHVAFTEECHLPSGPFKVGEAAFVLIAGHTDSLFICAAWPAENKNFCSIDTSVRFSLPDGNPPAQLSIKPSISAVVFKLEDWNARFGHSHAWKSTIEVAEICVRFFGDAMKNSHTNTKRLQVKAFLESKYVAAGSIVAKGKEGGLEIVSVKFSSNFSQESQGSESNSLSSSTKAHRLLKVTTNTTVRFVSLAETLKQSISLESRLDKVGGMGRAKEALMEVLCLPLKYKDVLERLGTTVPRGILLHGPPGVGKTLLIKEAARSLGIPVLSISASEIYSSALGQSELILRQIFDKAEGMMASNSSSSSFNTPSGTLPGDSTTNSRSNNGEQRDGNFGSSSRLNQYTVGGHNAGGVIIFIDEIDAICPKRSSDGDSSGGAQQLETRILAQLLTLLEQTRAIVVAATNRPNSLDPALRRPGRFDREIAIGLPNFEERIEILDALLQEVTISPSQTNLHESENTEERERNQLKSDLASKTQSWSGADLSSLVREAALNALRTTLSTNASLLNPENTGNSPNDDHQGEEGEENAKNYSICREDFEVALCRVRPTSQRGWTMEVPTTKWEDIGGLEEVKKQLRMLVEWPLKHSEAFTKLGLELPRGILLHGPPGCAKTTLVRAVASACKSSFVCLSGADVYSPLLGEAERKIREVFKSARAARPSIIFLDEIDAMVCKRGSESDAVSTRVLTQLLTEMDGVETIEKDAKSGNLLIIAATNRPDQLDPALLRPGRFDRIVEIPLPDTESRKAIAKIHLKYRLTPSDGVEEALNKVASMTEGCNGAEIQAICHEAAILALKRDIKTETVGIDLLLQAASHVTKKELISPEKHPDTPNTENQLVT